MSSEGAHVYEDEIDLRELVLKLWKHKVVILVVTLALALIGGLIGLAMSGNYQATAIVTLYQPVFPSDLGSVGLSSTDVSGSQVQTSMATNGTQAFYSTIRPTATDLANWATASDVLKAALASPAIPAKFSNLPLATVQSQAKATAIGNTLVQLQIIQDTPDAAAAVANAWAAVVVARLNDSYGISDGDLKLVKSQVDNAQQAFDQAEANLGQELRSNQSASLGVQLSEEKVALAAYLDKKNGLDLLSNDIQRVQGVLGKMAPSAPLPADQALTILLLQQRAVAVENSSAAPLQIPASGMFDANYTVGAAQAALDEFSASLKQEQSLLDANAVQVNNQLLETQTALESESHKLDRAIQARDGAKAQFLTLSVQLQQMQQYRQSAPVAKVTSAAVPPQATDSRPIPINAVLAGAVGLVLSVFGVLISDWWRNQDREEQKSRESITSKQER